MKKISDLSGLKAVILVGGPGTRLRPLTDDRPKPMVPVLNRPFLEHTIIHLIKYGVKDIILAMSYLPEAIPEYFGRGERWGVSLTYCVEKEPLGTAGAVKNVASYLNGSFITLNGDNVFIEMNWDEVFAFHREKKAKATIFLTRVDNPSAFGVVETNTEHHVQKFIEKPLPGTETTNWINAGGYILEPDVLDYIPADTHYMFERELFPDLLENGEPVYGYPYKGFWLDMGNPGKYFSLNIDLLRSQVKSPLLAPGDIKQPEKGAEIDPSAVRIPPVLIDSGCRVGKGATLKGPLVMGRDCRVAENACIENAILWDNVTIKAGARIERCIITSKVIINQHDNVSDRIVTPTKSVPFAL
jgi:mannose-1-phosphate guanylyltransferase